MIDNIDQLDTLTDAQLWEVAADKHNPAEIRQQAIQRWLYPDETNPDSASDDLGGGTWVRLLEPPVEGKLVHGFEGIDIGNRIRVEFISTDVNRGFIDFKKVGTAKH